MNSVLEKIRPIVAAAMFAAVLAPSWSPAQEEDLKQKIQALEARIARLEALLAAREEKAEAQPAEMQRHLDVLAEEVEKLRSGEPDIEITEGRARSLGLGSSAATVYRKRHGVSLAGYGEMLYENFDGQLENGSKLRKGSQLDFLRAVIYAGYRFNDKFVFNSEIEFEHADTGKSGTVAPEFVYLDYLANDHLTVRGGLLLVPMGLTNEFHEPTAFIGARRSETETRIIPATWRENGFGFLGSAGRFEYRAYVVNGLDAAGFSAAGLRGGRQKGSFAKATDMAFVGRLDFSPMPGVVAGGSLYRGGSGQGQYLLNGREIKVGTTIGELHGQVQMRGFDVRALYARAELEDVADLNRARNLTGANSIGEVLQGGFLQFGYNLLARHTESVRLTPYYRFEKVNTQDRVPAGFVLDPQRDRKFHTSGLEFHPTHGIVVKSDYQWIKSRARNGQNQFNILLGYAF